MLWRDVEASIQSRDVKRGEVLLAKLFKSGLTDDQLETYYAYRAQLRLLASRASDAIEDILCLAGTKIFELLKTQEILADSYLQRFEQSSTGFADKQDIQQSQIIYTRLLIQEPTYSNSGWLHYQLGRIYLILGDTKKAEIEFREAIFKPSHLTTLVAYCFERMAFISFYEYQDSYQADVYARKAIHVYPSAEPQQWLIQTYILRSRILQSGDLFEAIRSARKALSIAMQQPAQKTYVAESLFVLADVLSKSTQANQEVVEAIQHFLQLSKDPVGIDVTWSRAFEMLGDAQFDLKRYEAAIESYQHSLQYNPYHPWEETIYYRIGKCYYLLGQYQKALSSLLEIINNKEKTFEAYFYELVSSIYRMLGQTTEADKYSEIAKQRQL